MSLLLWMLLGFCAWTLILLGAGIGVWRWVLIFGGKAAITSFPGDTPHGSAAYRRVVRAHANCLETLPVFAALVLVAETIHADNVLMNALACAIMGGRLVQSCVHILFVERATTVAVRFSFFAVQFVALVLMGVLIARFALAAAHGAA